MNRPSTWRSLATGAAVLFGAFSAQAQGETPPPAENPFKAFDRAKFVEHAKTLGATDKILKGYQTQCEEESVGHASEALLRSLVKPYRVAAELAEDGDPKAALELASLIQAGSDPYVRAHSRYHLGRHFLDNDEPEKAAAILREYLRQDRNRTALDAEATFFFATALAEVPMAAEAALTFSDFLTLFPGAPER